MIKYSVIDHNVRETLDLNLSEYIIADCIYQLGNNPKNNVPGICTASNEYLAEWINLSVRGLQKILRRLEEKGIISQENGERKVTALYYNAVIVRKRNKKSDPVKVSPEILTNFNIVWSRYPKRIGKERGLRYYRRLIKSPEDHALLNKAITNYKLCQDVQDNMVMKFEKFIVDFRDWAEFKPIN